MQTLSGDRKALVDEVISRWNSHQRASTIAMALGMTRNSVIGIVNRARPKGLITRSDAPAAQARNNPARRPETAKAVSLPPPSNPVSDKTAKPVPAVEMSPMDMIRLPPPERISVGPQTLIDAPLFTCRVVVGQNEQGQDLYCCEPTFRRPDGTISPISCCEAHKPRMFAKHRVPTNSATAAADRPIDRISTTFKREQRAGTKKFFAFGKTLGISDE